jgi:hypothetical protein
MSKRTPLFEWHVAPDDAEWPVVAMPTSLGAPVTSVLDITAHRYTRQWLWGGVLTLLLLAGAGVWLWHTVQAGLDQIEGELSSAVQIDLASVASVPTPPGVTWATDAAARAWQDQLAREQNTLHTLLPQDIPVDQLTTNVETINLQGDRAVTEFVTTAKDEKQAYGQTRFYRHTAEGWQRTKPDAILWGLPRRLESDYFSYHFRQNDAQVVAAVAPQIDALYTELQHNFGLTPDVEKLIIDVTVEHVTGAVLTPQWEREPLVVPSPALYFAPVQLNDSTLLAQSIALPLIDYMGERVVEEYSIPYRGWPALDGVRLWQLWELEMPLAHWRQDIVKWLYIDIAADDPERHSVLPDRYAELCTIHSLWMLSPMLVGIPLECSTAEPVTWSQNRWNLSTTQLDRFSMPLADWEQLYDIEENYFYRSDKTVTVATLIEYAVATYGHEQLPVLLAGLAQYDSWDTLLPAVYGVSAADFEKGWQAYMAAEYGVQLGLSQP